MKLGHLRLLPLMGALVFGLVACSDSEKNGDPPARPEIFARTPELIARDALMDMPSAEFVAVRGRLKSSVTKDRRDYARSFAIAGGRGAAIAGDPGIAAARQQAASSLGITLDPAKIVDVGLANATLDQLLKALHERFPGAQSCADARGKEEDCTIALLVIEVQRCEAATVLMDAGTSILDGSTTTNDGGVVVAPDATVADSATDSARPIPTGPVMPIDCLARDTAGAREVMGGVVSTNETWSGKVWLRRSLYFSGTLTIMPGTEIFMDADTSITIGYSNAESTIRAEGTLASPIRFCGRTAEAGHWGQLIIASNVTANSVLQNVLFADGGGGMKPALELGADVLVQNVQVRNSEHSGVSAIDFVEGSAQLSVDGSGGTAVTLTGTGAITRFPRGGFLVNNVDNTAHLRFQWLDANTVVHKIGIPYVQQQNQYQRMGELTFEPGVDYRFAPSVGLDIAYSNANTAIHVNGTQAEPVIFRGVSDASANWGGIQIGATAMLTSNLTWLQIQQAGSGTSVYALQLDGAIKVNDVTLRGNALGVRVGAAGFAPGSANLTVTDTQNYPILAHPDALVTLPVGGRFENNTTNQIRVDGNMVRKGGTIADHGIPYFVPLNLYVSAGANLTVAPGTDFLIGSGVSLYIGYGSGPVTFIANGTADAPIRFTGLTPTTGFWGSIVIEADVSTTSSFSYVQVGHGGKQGSTDSALLILNANVPVMNSRFFDGAAWGIEKRMANPNDYMLTNTFENVPMGAVRVYR